MNLTIVATPEFQKSVKKLFKRYKLIAKDLADLEKELQQNTHAGIELGNGLFKIRLKNSSVPIGKSGGFRVIYFLRTQKKIYLLEIYSKSDLENINEHQLVEIMKSNSLI